MEYYKPESINFKLPFVLQKFEPDFPPLADHEIHLDNERTYISSPDTKNVSLNFANCFAKYILT
jgi:hypothetical protein